MSQTSGPLLLSDIARLASSARARDEFRVGTLALLHGAIQATCSLFLSPGRGVPVATRGIAPLTERLLGRGSTTVWSELAAVRTAAATQGGVVEASRLIGADAELSRILRRPEPPRGACLGLVSDGRAVLVLFRAEAPFADEEMELLRHCLPVVGLGDQRATEIHEALGATLTPRELEIFDFVSRGYNNREIASVLGTSPFTVRNQLCRLFRKVGVSGRSELVGLAAHASRREAAT